VHLREARAEHEVLGDRRDTVADIAVHRHAATDWISEAGEARSERHVGVTGEDGRDQQRHCLRLVLVVRMKEHHDVGAARESLRVARLLIAAVSEVLAMDVDFDAELARELSRVVGACVVDEDEPIGDPGRDVRDGLRERSLGPVGGQCDDDPRQGRTRVAATAHDRVLAGQGRRSHSCGSGYTLRR
jgi:hypothetical protein